ncbi:MAG: hypothetical protein KKG00_04850 [Bacteroidetes bacterium]|nr:hypothetical protein [Bacteroidota bacterium]
MFDGIKILNAVADVEELIKNPQLDWRLHVQDNTGSIESRTAEVKNLRLTIKGKGTQVRGSIHKYSNAGLHNADDFTADRVSATIESIEVNLGIGRNSVLNNLEFGVNIETPFPPQKLLERLICHQGTEFTRHSDKGHEYYQCQHAQYILKIYDKGTEFGLQQNLLRFEIKVLRMQYLQVNGIPIRTLADLANSEFYPALGELLLAKFSEILIDEPGVPTTGLCKKDADLLTQGRNPKYWRPPVSTDYPDQRTYRTARKTRERQLRDFRKLLEHCPIADHWQATTADLIKEKWAILSNSVVANLPYILNVNLRQSGILSPKICPITGADISEQKDSSKYLSERSLKDNPGILYQVGTQYRQRTRKRKNHSPAYYAAHNVRNEANNPANNLRKRLMKLQNGNFLFEPAEMIILKDEDRKLLERWKGTPYEVKLSQKRPPQRPPDKKIPLTN